MKYARFHKICDFLVILMIFLCFASFLKCSVQLKCSFLSVNLSDLTNYCQRMTVPLHVSRMLLVVLSFSFFLHNAML